MSGRSAQGARRRAQVAESRRAFTLVEMLVSLFVLVIALAIVTNVFSITNQTASTVAAVNDAQVAARAFMNELRADLEAVNTERSILVLEGRTQAAAHTPQDLQAGRYWRVLTGDPTLVDPAFDPTGAANPANSQYSDPRADLLMFFRGPGKTSEAPPDPMAAIGGNNAQADFRRALQRGADTFDLQVMYGHAAVTNVRRVGGNFEWSPNSFDHIENTNGLSALPLTRWNLVRRQAVLNEDPDAAAQPASVLTAFQQRGAFDRISRCVSGNNPANSLRDSGDGVDENFSLSTYLELFGPTPPMATFSNLAARLSPYKFDPTGSAPAGGGPAWSPTDLRRAIWSVMYNNSDPTDHHFATILESPPVELRSNLGLHRLPGCAWFQVEFLMPEDPRNSADHPDPAQRAETLRWVEVPAGATYVFVPDTPENRRLVESQNPENDNRLKSFGLVVPLPPPPPPTAVGENTASNRFVRMWPYAIRVTVRVFDPRGRLSHPVERSLIHRFD